MDATLTHAGETPAIRGPIEEAREVGRAFRRFLLAVAYAAANRLTSPQRDLPTDYYHFPPY